MTTTKNVVKYRDNGITLIALIVTVIVLLILAGVSIAMVTGDNGLLNKARESVEMYSKEETKERIKLVLSNAKIKNTNDLDENMLEQELSKEFGNNYEILLVGEDFLIEVNNIAYMVNKEGNAKYLGKSENADFITAGDLTCGGQYDGLTLETAYRITCIEDLIEWTKNPNKYNDKIIKLEKTIDFNSINSYYDYKAKSTDINKNSKIESLITELTTGEGFIPISKFSGIFDGQGYEIRNIYINCTGTAGLFVNMSGKICNLKITGSITSQNGHAGGFSGGGYAKRRKIY